MVAKCTQNVKSKKQRSKYIFKNKQGRIIFHLYGTIKQHILTHNYHEFPSDTLERLANTSIDDIRLAGADRLGMGIPEDIKKLSAQYSSELNARHNLIQLKVMHRFNFPQHTSSLQYSRYETERL